METRIHNSRVKEVIKKIGLPKWKIVDGLGFSGGIWRLWDDREVDVTIDDSFFQAITVSVKHNNKEWSLKTVYGSPAPNNREQLWNYLKDKS
ncbi:hypothetical protein COLO4_33181 [Corchorus olitorius]|uniref:Endonuclease/exonuclease/phosphatase n=1 Tax=Corchorus olitorius TaxID=93759 RepID=A0A1R3GVU0_9ROSI|nr:hypothetical protein COLO4_33181 [Corchorus olitorius]